MIFVSSWGNSDFFQSFAKNQARSPIVLIAFDATGYNSAKIKQNNHGCLTTISPLFSDNNLIGFSLNWWTVGERSRMRFGLSSCDHRFLNQLFQFRYLLRKVALIKWLFLDCKTIARTNEYQADAAYTESVAPFHDIIIKRHHGQIASINRFGHLPNLPAYTPTLLVEKCLGWPSVDIGNKLLIRNRKTSWSTTTPMCLRKDSQVQILWHHVHRSWWIPYWFRKNDPRSNW